MTELFSYFERIARTARNASRPADPERGGVHPFDDRNIHPDISDVSVKLFDNGHYAQATFEAFKLVEKRVKDISCIEWVGFSLMMNVFDEERPKIRLTNLQTLSEKDEQKGFRHIFAGAIAAIRNPRGHDIRVDSIDLCLDHLSLASVLLRRLESRLSA